MRERLRRTYYRLALDHAKNRWEKEKRSMVKGAVITLIAGLLIAWAAVKSADQDPAWEILISILIPLASIGIWMLVYWVWCLISSPPEIHSNQHIEFEKLQARLDALECPIHDMHGWQVLDRMFQMDEQFKSEIGDPLEVRHNIGLALSAAALEGSITIRATELMTRREILLDKTIFKENTIMLEPKDEEQAERLGIDRHFDIGNSALGGSIQPALDGYGKDIYFCPMFCEAQIELRWPLTKQPTSDTQVDLHE